VNGRFRSVGRMLTSAARLFAVYASVRAALRAEAVYKDKAVLPEQHGRPGQIAKRAERRAERSVAKVSAATEVRPSNSLAPVISLPPSEGHRVRRGTEVRTYRQLYEEARLRDVRGRSRMSKAALEAALARSRTGASEARRRKPTKRL
jgi:hypothetical protein